MSITLGLAENYAMLGNKFLYLEDVIDVKGFMGSDFLSYSPLPGINSNGIDLTGSIPNAPIVNGAAAKQAIADVNTAIPLYQAVTPAYPPITGPINLNATYISPGRYDIIGDLTTNVDVTLYGTATSIYVFNVTGKIYITNNISLSGLLPQNVIFIASDTVYIYNNVTVYGIYISTGNYAFIEGSALTGSELTGRLICTGTAINAYTANQKSTIIAP